LILVVILSDVLEIGGHERERKVRTDISSLPNPTFNKPQG
jgi:hypothetical protein